ncbi:MAG TPA: hypothetical protein VIW70_18135 [Rubrivivax sp.]
MPSESAWRGFRAALHGLAVAALVAWASSHAGWAEVGRTGALLLGAAVSTLAWAVGATPPARLRWSGSEWLLQKRGGAESAVPAPAVMIDLGAWMLLRVRATGAREEWLAAARAHMQAAWLPFRAAVYSSAPPAGTGSNPERPPF